MRPHEESETLAIGAIGVVVFGLSIPLLKSGYPIGYVLASGAGAVIIFAIFRWRKL